MATRDATTAPPRAGSEPPSEAAIAWVDTFISFWTPPAREHWYAHYEEHFHPQVCLIQPLSPPAHGHAAVREWMDGVFGLIGDLHADVEGWSASGDVVYIDFVLKGTLGGRPIAWRACDRCTLEDGLLIERESYFDSLPLLMTLLTRPRAWPAVVRSGSAAQLLKSAIPRGGKR